jgi:hypothetical protein
LALGRAADELITAAWIRCIWRSTDPFASIGFAATGTASHSAASASQSVDWTIGDELSFRQSTAAIVAADIGTTGAKCHRTTTT